MSKDKDKLYNVRVAVSREFVDRVDHPRQVILGIMDRAVAQTDRALAEGGYEATGPGRFEITYTQTARKIKNEEAPSGKSS
jgi:hypothetical protein